jgi:hypothetical protein
VSNFLTSSHRKLRPTLKAHARSWKGQGESYPVLYSEQPLEEVYSNACSVTPGVRLASGAAALAYDGCSAAAARWHSAAAKVMAVVRLKRGADWRPPIERIPLELLALVFAFVDSQTLALVVPNVSQGWRDVCAEMMPIRLDFGWSVVGKYFAHPHWSPHLHPHWDHHPHFCPRLHPHPHPHPHPGPHPGPHPRSCLCRHPHPQHTPPSYFHPAPPPPPSGRAGKDDLAKASPLTDLGLSGVAPRFPRAISANIDFCRKVTDAGLGVLASHCHQLKAVSLWRCEHITDAGLDVLSRNCSKLTSLNLWRCEHITDAGLAAVARQCAQLNTFNLSYCENISDVGLSALAEGCQQLTTINLSYVVAPSALEAWLFSRYDGGACAPAILDHRRSRPTSS